MVVKDKKIQLLMFPEYNNFLYMNLEDNFRSLNERWIYQ